MIPLSLALLLLGCSSNQDTEQEVTYFSTTDTGLYYPNPNLAPDDPEQTATSTNTEVDTATDTADTGTTETETDTSTETETQTETETDTATFEIPEDAMPDFALADANPYSASYGEIISPRNYIQQVSGWYFIKAT